MLEARISGRQQPALVIRLFRDEAEVATLSTDVALVSLTNDVDPMVELMASVLGILINQLPDDERAHALAHVRAAHANGLGQWATPPWPTLQ